MTSAFADRHIPEPEHGHSEPLPHHEIPYIGVFIALVALTIITVAVALHRFEPELINVLIALLVASIKGSLVALYFMHLKFEGKLIYLIFIVPLCFSVLLVMALIPDIVLTHASSNSASLHLFNEVERDYVGQHTKAPGGEPAAGSKTEHARPAANH